MRHKCWRVGVGKVKGVLLLGQSQLLNLFSVGDANQKRSGKPTCVGGASCTQGGFVKLSDPLREDYLSYSS